MTPRKVKTRTIERTKYTIYRHKARDFRATMRTALADGHWNSAGLAAVHCVISATDALLTYISGVRSISSDHGDVVYLLRLHVKHAELNRNAKRLQGILGQKNRIEYEARLFTQQEAARLVDQAERYLTWVDSLLPT